MGDRRSRTAGQRAGVLVDDSPEIINQKEGLELFMVRD
jgi:hypothetical protein